MSAVDQPAVPVFFLSDSTGINIETMGNARLITTPARLIQVRRGRRSHSTYASLEQGSYELRRAEAKYRSHHSPMINSSAKWRRGPSSLQSPSTAK